MVPLAQINLLGKGLLEFKLQYNYSKYVLYFAGISSNRTYRSSLGVSREDSNSCLTGLGAVFQLIARRIKTILFII